MLRTQEEEILEWILSPDERLNDKAFKFIYREHYGIIEKFILSNSGKGKDAEDIFQDALIVFFHQVKKQNLELSCNIQTYLYSICRNLWLKKIRKNKREINLEDEHIQFVKIEETHFDTLLANEQNQIVADLLDHLGEDCKKVLLYFYFEKNKMAEIAQKMNLANEQVAKNKKSNCLKKLRSLVNESEFFKKVFERQ